MNTNSKWYACWRIARFQTRNDTPWKKDPHEYQLIQRLWHFGENWELEFANVTSTAWWTRASYILNIHVPSNKTSTPRRCLCVTEARLSPYLRPVSDQADVKVVNRVWCEKQADKKRSTPITPWLGEGRGSGDQRAENMQREVWTCSSSRSDTKSALYHM